MAQSTKQALLAALSAAEGGYISGQQLAEGLGVSRAAIHKAALALTAQGYALDSAPRRGYRLAGGDPFCAEAVGEYPAPIYLYDTLESSNLTTKQLALAGAPHGTLVLAGQQKAGRGRLGRRFESPAGKGVFSCQRAFVIFYLLNSDITGGVVHNYAFFLYSPTHRVSAKEVRLESRWCPRSCSECGAAAPIHR